MKFLKHHELDILDAMERCGFSKEQFHFIKRKGRILTEYRLDQSYFSYFLKKDVELHPQTNEFLSISKFEVKSSNGLSTFVTDWTMVMKHFANWLKDLPLP